MQSADVLNRTAFATLEFGIIAPTAKYGFPFSSRFPPTLEKLYPNPLMIPDPKSFGLIFISLSVLKANVHYTNGMELLLLLCIL